MRLAQFTTTNGIKIGINPDHVVTVRPSGESKDKTAIFLATGQIVVEGTIDEVAERLMGNHRGGARGVPLA